MDSSVVISTFNGIAFVEEQLNSIRKQTVAPREVIIADDCSTDGTFEFIKEYIEINRLDTWNVSRNKRNIGWKKNFWQLIKKAKYEYIFLADQDDIWSLNKIEALLASAEKYPQGELFYSNFKSFENVEEINTLEKVKLKNTSQVVCDVNFTTLPAPGCTFLIKRSLYTESSKYWDSDFPHDFSLWVTAMLRETVYHNENVLHYWRMHKSSAYYTVPYKKMSNLVEFRDNANKIFIKRRNVAHMRIAFLEKWQSINDRNTKVQDSLIFEKKRILYLENKKICMYIRSIFNYREFYSSFDSMLADFYIILFSGGAQ